MDLWVTALLCYIGGISTGLVLSARTLAKKEAAPPAPPRVIGKVYDRSDKVLAAEERKKKGIPDPSPRMGGSRVVYDVQAPTR